MKEPKGEDLPLTPESERSPAASYADSVRAYLENAETESVLRSDQVDVFTDLQAFFESGHTKGYIELPTGTGKTVLFVELTKALIEGKEPEDRPKVLVVTSTKDLVRQTMGRSGQKGYGRFAPDLKVGSFFSDSTAKEKREIDEYDAVVTTYPSFDILNRSFDMVAIEDMDDQDLDNYAEEFVRLVGRNALYSGEDFGRLRFPVGDSFLSKFDVIILDEAHHALSENTKAIIRSLAKDKVVIGFTATPDADEERQLINTLPIEIHKMSLHEAIEMDLLAPVVPIGIKSGVSIRGSDIYDESGDFLDSRISYLARDAGRNDVVLDAAEILAGQNIGTLISCIAGGEAWHAKHLAQQLNERGVRAQAVYSRMASAQRAQIYKQFEDGEIDVLTYIGVLGEGWDSDRAKGLVNARPTRSPIVGPQRIGRTTRPGSPAIVIDICDDYGADNRNPPITGADVLGTETVEYGTAIGTIEDRTAIDITLELLRARLPVLDRLERNYADYETLLATLSRLHSGVTTLETGLKYAVASKVNNNYQGVNEEILDRAAELSGKPLTKTLAARRNIITTVYNVREAQSLLTSLPEVDPKRYHIDLKGGKWLAPQGIVSLFSKRYPGVSEEIIDELLKDKQAELEWMPASYSIIPPNRSYSRRHAITKLYPSDEQTINIINEELSRYFSAS